METPRVVPRWLDATVSVGAAVLERPAPPPDLEDSAGGVPARRAMIRWAWRLFRREWRQQILILALVTVAVRRRRGRGHRRGREPAPATFGFGTAGDMATFHGPTRNGLADRLARAPFRAGRRDREPDDEVPGSIDTFDLRAQDPAGPYGGPMLSLLSGATPPAPGRWR